MTVSIEPLTKVHLYSPALQSLFSGDPPESILLLEKSGGVAQAILHGNIIVGILTVTTNLEVMIAIHPDHRRKGIALAALNFFKSVAAQRKIISVTAKAMIGRPGDRLLQKFGAVETARTHKEIFL